MSTKRKKRSIYKIAAAILVINGLVSMGSIGTVKTQINLLYQAHAVLDAVSNLDHAVMGHQNAFHAYLISGGLPLEAAYRQSTAAMNEALKAVKKVSVHAQLQQARVASLAHVLTERDEEFRNAETVLRSHGAQQAWATFATERGRRTSGEIDRLIAEMKTDEVAQLNHAGNSARVAAESLWRTFSIASVIALSLLAFVAYFSKREMAERERSAAAIRQSEEWLSATLSSISDAVIATDEKGQIRYINPVAESLTGWGSAEAKGKRLEQVFTVVDEESRAPVGNPVDWVIKRGVPLPPSNHTLLLSRDGSERAIENSGAPIRGVDDSITGVVLCFRDVTVRVQVENELKASKEAADAANRSKDQFLAVLSHELRTPLAPVLMAVSGMLQDDLPEDLRPTLEMIERNIVLESRMIDDLLDVSRIARGQMRLDLQVVDVHDAIRRALEMCHAEIKSTGLQVVLNLEATSCHTLADKVRLMQVFWNLTSNAVKYAPGAVLSVRTWNDPFDLDSTANPRLVVEFKDDGLGIEPDLLPRIFTPFEQGDRLSRRGGLGLGLAIGKRVVDAHGGRLSVASNGRGWGAAFRVELTTVPSPVPAVVHPAPPPDDENGTGPLKILVVEDNKDTLRYMAIVLGKRGYTVRTADNVAAATAALATEHFDLLVSDVELPDGTGLELMRNLKSAGSRTKGIALSGFGSEDDVRLSLDAGFAVHLNKPVDVVELEESITRTVGDGQGKLALHSGKP